MFWRAIESMICMLRCKASGLRNSRTKLRIPLGSAFGGEDWKSNAFSIDGGFQVVMSLLWFENRNLFPAGPQNTATFSPNKEVRNTIGEYFFILSFINLAGLEFLPPKANSRVSPMMGHPSLPGGSFEQADLRLLTRKIIQRDTKRTIRCRRYEKRSMAATQ